MRGERKPEGRENTGGVPCGRVRGEAKEVFSALIAQASLQHLWFLEGRRGRAKGGLKGAGGEGLENTGGGRGDEVAEIPQTLVGQAGFWLAWQNQPKRPDFLGIVLESAKVRSEVTARSGEGPRK